MEDVYVIRQKGTEYLDQHLFFSVALHQWFLSRVRKGPRQWQEGGEVERRRGGHPMVPGQNSGLLTHGCRQTRDRLGGRHHFSHEAGHTESQEQREMVELFICLPK